MFKTRHYSERLIFYIKRYWKNVITDGSRLTSTDRLQTEGGIRFLGSVCNSRQKITIYFVIRNKNCRLEVYTWDFNQASSSRNCSHYHLVEAIKEKISYFIMKHILFFNIRRMTRSHKRYWFIKGQIVFRITTIRTLILLMLRNSILFNKSFDTFPLFLLPRDTGNSSSLKMYG